MVSQSFTVTVGDSATTFTQIANRSRTLAQGDDIFNVSGNFADADVSDSADLRYVATSATPTTALTSKVWLIYLDEANQWQAQEVGDIGDASKIPLPVDISIFADDTRLWVDTWNDGMARLYDISDPHHAKQIYSEKIGEQINMVSQSWDGKRVYFSSSLLANWDKTEPKGEDLQYLKLYGFDGETLKHKLSIDFVAAGLGAPHQMRFGAYSLYNGGKSAAR